MLFVMKLELDISPMCSSTIDFVTCYNL